MIHSPIAHHRHFRGLTGVLFRTQINEAITYHQTYENKNNKESQGEHGDNDQHYRENCWDYEREHDYENTDFFESGLFTKPSADALIVFHVFAGLCALLEL
jgi:hypothetical protein